MSWVELAPESALVARDLAQPHGFGLQFAIEAALEARNLASIGLGLRIGGRAVGIGDVFRYDPHAA